MKPKIKPFGAIVDLVEPLGWFLFKKLNRKDMLHVQFGDCSLYGGIKFLENADRISSKIVSLDSQLWDEIRNTKFALVQETGIGQYKRTTNKRFSIPSDIHLAPENEFICDWVFYYFFAAELDSRKFLDRYFFKPDPISAIENTISWIEKHKLQGNCYQKLKSFLQQGGKRKEGAERVGP